MDKILFSSEKGYSIYQGNNNFLGYYICIPQNDVDAYELYIGFSKRNLNGASNEEIISEIDEVACVVNKFNKQAIYLLPIINYEDYKEATSDNDYKLYNELYRKISSMTEDVYEMLTENGKNDVKVNQIITIIKQNDMDTKFADWLELIPELSKYIKGINFNTLSFDKYDYDEDLDKTMIAIPNDLIVQNIKNINERSKPKKRILTKPSINHYGFSSVYSMGFILLGSIFSGIFIGLMILK